MSLPFHISDTSPLLAYSPCVNCVSGSSGSWRAAYKPRGDGYDQTYHEASSSSGDITPLVQLNLTASTIEILSEGGYDGCGMRYKIDDGDYTGGCLLSSFPPGRHTLTIAPRPGVPSVQLSGITGTSQLSQSGSFQNETLDNASSAFRYSGSWTYLTSEGVVGQAANQTAADQLLKSGMGSFYNSSSSITTVSGSEVLLNFEGSGIYLYGIAGPSGGSAAISLDDELYSVINTTGPWQAYSSLYFFATNLTEGPHVVKISNLIDGRQLVLDYAQVTIPTKSSGLKLPTIIGIISGISAIVLLTAVSLYIYCTRRKRKPKKIKTTYGFSQGFSYRDLSPAKASTIDTWRKKTAGSSHTSTPSTASLVSPYGGGFLAAHVQPGRTAHSPGRSPPPEYPDYLPYRGPIETRPPPRPESIEVPGIVGLNDSTNGWLSQVVAARSPMETDINRERSARVVHRPEPIPLRERNVQTAESNHTVLDSYYNQQDLISPASTMSSLGFTSMTTRAIGATRSVARLWPTSVLITNSPPHTIDEDGSTVSQITPPANHRNDPGLFIDSMRYPPLPSTAVSTTARTPPSGTMSSRAMDYSNASRDTLYRSSSGQSPSTTPLRRGVSIKSVKTMRSFFSGLLGSGAGSPFPETPALPATYSDTFMVATPARPDSDIFPAASISRSNSLVRDPSRSANLVTSSRYDNGREAKDVPVDSPDRPRITMQSYTSSVVPPLLRLDTSENNFFIELNPDSPVTRVEGSRASGMTSLPDSWGYRGQRI